jgi:polar amino acid transport system substrate-binding protein
MMKKAANLLSLILVVLLAIGAAGCSKKAEPAISSGVEVTKAAEATPEATKAETQLDKIKKAGKIVMGTSADFPPYESHKLVNGKDEIVGFDIEIAKEIAKDLGVELEIKDMKFDGLLAALDTGNVDMVVAGMTPTEERKKQVDFSNVYYRAVQTILVRAEDKATYTTIESLKGKKVGVQKGSLQEKIATEQLKDVQIKAIGKVSDLVLELKNKKVDVVLTEGAVGTAYVSKHSDLAVGDLTFKTDEDGSAIALKKGSTELQAEINKTIDKLIAADSINKFFGEASQDAESQN